MQISVVIEKDFDGYVAYAPTLKGCITQGDTFEDAYKNIQEAIELYVETLDNEQLGILNSQESFLTVCEIAHA